MEVISKTISQVLAKRTNGLFEYPKFALTCMKILKPQLAKSNFLETLPPELSGYSNHFFVNLQLNEANEMCRLFYVTEFGNNR